MNNTEQTSKIKMMKIPDKGLKDVILFLIYPAFIFYLSSFTMYDDLFKCRPLAVLVNILFYELLLVILFCILN